MSAKIIFIYGPRGTGRARIAQGLGTSLEAEGKRVGLCDDQPAQLIKAVLPLHDYVIVTATHPGLLHQLPKATVVVRTEGGPL